MHGGLKFSEIIGLGDHFCSGIVARSPGPKFLGTILSILYSSNRLLDIFIAAKMIDAYPKDNTIEQKTLQELLLDFLIAAIG